MRRWWDGRKGKRKAKKGKNRRKRGREGESKKKRIEKRANFFCKTCPRHATFVAVLACRCDAFFLHLFSILNPQCFKTLYTCVNSFSLSLIPFFSFLTYSTINLLFLFIFSFPELTFSLIFAWLYTSSSIFQSFFSYFNFTSKSPFLFKFACPSLTVPTLSFTHHKGKGFGKVQPYFLLLCGPHYSET